MKLRNGITIRSTGAAGRAGLEINVVRRGPVNGGVSTESHARDQRDDPIALMNIA